MQYMINLVWEIIRFNVLIYLAIINIAAWILYGIDKKRAIQGKWRISERLLLCVTGMGGSLGAVLGMYLFRHKTRHWKFRILVPLFLVLHIVMLTALIF